MPRGIPRARAILSRAAAAPEPPRDLQELIRLLPPEEVAAEIAALPDALRERLAAGVARDSFAEFVRQAWDAGVVMSVDPLVWSWHLDAVCSHLEAVARGKITRLLINIPPGHAKSTLMCVLWPAWIWTWWPGCQMLFGSYSADLSSRDSVRCRDLVTSPWYQELFAAPSGWGLRHDQNAKQHFVNTAGGLRFACGIGGTGRRAHIIGIDDPLDAAERFSKAARSRANDWIGKTLSQRFVDPRSGRTAMIMQRLHEDDPSGFVLAGGGWEHLRLPSEFEAEFPSVTHAVGDDGARVEFWRDPRTEDGELLFPARFPREALERAKRDNELGAEGFAEQHQQRPMPPGGGMFKVADWRFWKPDGTAPEHSAHRPRGCWDGEAQPLPQEFDRVVISVDATFTKTTSGSFVAIHVWGAHGARRFLLDRVHARMDFGETVKALLGIIARWPEAREKVIEAKANGSAIMSTLENNHGISGIVPENPGRENKEQRASAMLPYHRAGNVYLPDGAPWLDEYVGEHAAFPKGTYNDDVDAQSQALKHLERPAGGLESWGEVDLS